MKRLIITGIWILLLVKYCAAQEQLSIKQQADKLYERYEYFKSLSFYLKLVNDKTDVKILERIADCYRNINHYDEAETFYARAVADAKASKISHCNYAEILLRNQKFEEAKNQYKLYFTDDAETLKLKLSTCDSAAAWMKQSSFYAVKNEAGFNTEYSDWGLSYNGKTGLVFTSDRKTNEQDIDKRTGNNWFKLYKVDTKDKAVDELSVLTEDNSIFTGNYHIGPMVLNKAADNAYITVTTAVADKKLSVDKAVNKTSQTLYTRRLQLVMAVKKNGQWVVFGSFPFNNIQKYSVGNAALSKDGKLIYFTSDMPGSEGKTDIWCCEKQPNGTWGNPVNCGKNINTKEEESFPVIGGDGYLYYSSKGLPGMGGYDIYKAKGEKAQWDIPVNLKYPINTTSDDFYLVTNDGTSGYFSSNREVGKGSDDIYSFSLVHRDSIPVNRITQNNNPVPPPVIPVKPETNFVLNNIYYDLDKSNIRPDAAIELDKLVILLKQQPELKISVSSYTDSRASDKYNMGLSQRRAKSAVAYLVKRGIAANRLLVNYYGKTHLVNQCAEGVKCTEAAHQLNRRTEFKVMSI
jgi:outer membrane protein OmpA-like peptidoglycan-associated protein/tetratricopeptide (TPR) repeat protein